MLIWFIDLLIDLPILLPYYFRFNCLRVWLIVNGMLLCFKPPKVLNHRGRDWIWSYWKKQGHSTGAWMPTSVVFFRSPPVKNGVSTILQSWVQYFHLPPSLFTAYKFKDLCSWLVNLNSSRSKDKSMQKNILKRLSRERFRRHLIMGTRYQTLNAFCSMPALCRSSIACKHKTTLVAFI